MGRSNNIAKYTFLYLVSLLTLVFSVIAVGNIIFQLINKHIVDIINISRALYSPGVLKFALSSLLVAAPVYYYSTSIVYRSLIEGKLDRDSAVRRWLTYLIIFVCGVVMVGWLIAIVYSVLDGDLTLKFSLKTLTVLVLASVVGSYYFRDIKKDRFSKDGDSVVRMYYFGTLALVLVSFMAGVFFVESPRETRLRKIDDLTISKFENISNALSTYYRNNSRLPMKLDELIGGMIYLRIDDIRDVVSDEVYEYVPIEVETGRYKICANFNLSNIEKDSPKRGYLGDVWPHSAGRECFSRQVVKVPEGGILERGGEVVPVIRESVIIE